MGLKMKRDVRTEREGSKNRSKDLFPYGVTCLVEQEKVFELRREVMKVELGDIWKRHKP